MKISIYVGEHREMLTSSCGPPVHGIIRQPISGLADGKFYFKSLTVTNSCKPVYTTITCEFGKTE